MQFAFYIRKTIITFNGSLSGLLSGLPAQIHLVGPFTTHWVLLKREFLDIVLFLTIFELKCCLERQPINTHPCFEWLWCHPGEVNFTPILFATLKGSSTTIQRWLFPPWHVQDFLLCLLQCKNEFSEIKFYLTRKPGAEQRKMLVS